MAYFFLGIALLAAFLAQDFMDWKWPWLEQLQDDETYRQISGLILTLYILHQWYLSLLRINKEEQAAWKQADRHKFWGALAPLFFFVHSTQFGYAYLFLLSSVYFAIIVLGLFNDETLPIKKMAFTNSWMLVHVCLSVSLVGLTGYHIYVAFSYE